MENYAYLPFSKAVSISKKPVGGDLSAINLRDSNDNLVQANYCIVKVAAKSADWGQNNPWFFVQPVAGYSVSGGDVSGADPGTSPPNNYDSSGTGGVLGTHHCPAEIRVSRPYTFSQILIQSNLNSATDFLITYGFIGPTNPLEGQGVTDKGA